MLLDQQQLELQFMLCRYFHVQLIKLCTVIQGTTSSQIIAIPILEDTILESSETINVTLMSVDPAAILNPASAVIAIEDNDGK